LIPTFGILSVIISLCLVLTKSLSLSPLFQVDILATTSLKKRLRAIEKTLDWLELNQHQQQQQQQQAPQSQPQQPHDLSLDCELEQEAVEAAGVGVGVDECCLYVEPHTDEEELMV